MKMLTDFLIKFNLLAIPMYIIILSGFEFVHAQSIIAEISYRVIDALGYSISKIGITLSLTLPSSIATVVIGSDCTAWKSMYMLAALMIASPVANNRKKLKHILIGISAIFLINIIRIVTTMLSGYWFGFQSLEIVHTALWQQGMILAVVGIWFIWVKKQKVIFREKQTILKSIYR